MKRIYLIGAGELADLFQAPRTYFTGGFFLFFCFCTGRIFLTTFNVSAGEGRLSPTGQDAISGLLGMGHGAGSGLAEAIGAVPGAVQALLIGTLMGLPVTAFLVVSGSLTDAIRTRRLRYLALRAGRLPVYLGMAGAYGIALLLFTAIAYVVVLSDSAARSQAMAFSITAVPAARAFFFSLLYGWAFAALSMLFSVIARGSKPAFFAGAALFVLFWAIRNVPGLKYVSLFGHIHGLWKRDAANLLEALAAYIVFLCVFLWVGARGFKRIDL